MKLGFLSVKALKSQDTRGIHAAITESLDDFKALSALDIDIQSAFHNCGILKYHEKLVGFGADGASVNRGSNEGVRAMLEEKAPLVYVWCIRQVHIDLNLPSRTL